MCLLGGMLGGPERPAPGVRAPRCKANSLGFKQKKEQNNQGLNTTLVCELMLEGWPSYEN